MHSTPQRNPCHNLKSTDEKKMIFYTMSNYINFSNPFSGWFVWGNWLLLSLNLACVQLKIFHLCSSQHLAQMVSEIISKGCFDQAKLFILCKLSKIQTSALIILPWHGILYIDIDFKIYCIYKNLKLCILELTDFKIETMQQKRNLICKVTVRAADQNPFV